MTEKIYIGTKVIAAEPMTEEEFIANPKNWPGYPYEKPADGGRPGYRVRYEDGYVSWSPKEVFERCYRETTVAEQRLVLFAGDKWPEGQPGPLRLNMIVKQEAARVNACHIRESLGKIVPESEWPEGLSEAIQNFEKESKS